MDKSTAVICESSSWFDSLPEGWSLEPLSHLFDERKTKVHADDYQPLSVTKHGVVPQLDHVAKSEAIGNRKLVCKGDIVINSRSDRRGASGISDYDGSVSLIYIVLKPRNIESKFAHYLFRSKRFQDEFYRRGSGIVADLWSTNFSAMKNIMLPLPPMSGQKEIADYLDATYREYSGVNQSIDELLMCLSDKKKSIVLRGVKQEQKVSASNIEWLNSIPSGWKEIKAKYLFEEQKRQVSESDEIVTAFRDGQVCLRKNRRTTGYTMAIKEHGYQGIRKGDLVIHSMDAFAGAIGVSEDNGKATPEYVVVKPFDKGNLCTYFAEVLRIMAERQYILVICQSVRERAPRFRYSKFAEMLLPVPPVEEQLLIVNELDNLSSLEKELVEYSLMLNKKFEALLSNVVLGKEGN